MMIYCRREGVCNELDELKDMYYALPDLLTKVGSPSIVSTDSEDNTFIMTA